MNNFFERYYIKPLSLFFSAPLFHSSLPISPRPNNWEVFLPASFVLCFFQERSEEKIFCFFVSKKRKHLRSLKKTEYSFSPPKKQNYRLSAVLLAQKRKHFLPPSLPAQKQSIFEESAKKKKTCGEISVETHRRDRRRLCFRFWTGKIILGGQNGRELGEKNGEKAQKSKAFFFQTFLHTSLFSGSAIKIKSEASAHSVFLPFCYPLWGK